MKKKILIAEDEPHILRLLCLQVRKSYHPFPVSNGNQAVELAVSEIPDLIIMDISMPGMDGLEACRLIRENPKTAAIPMLAATARVSSRDMQEIHDSGFADVIQKPFGYKDLAPHIEALLGMKEPSPLPSQPVARGKSQIRITEIESSETGIPVNCQRCQAGEVSYHVSSHLLDVMVCSRCAHIARDVTTITLLAPKRRPPMWPTWRRAKRA